MNTGPQRAKIKGVLKFGICNCDVQGATQEFREFDRKKSLLP
jgi:hypothetical protein